MTPHRAGRPARPRPRLIAAGIAAVIAAVVSIATALPTFATDGWDGVFGPFLGAYGAVLYAFVGIVVLWQRPGHPIGRLALIIGLAFTISLAVDSVPWPGALYDVGRFLSGGLLIVGWVAGGSLLVVRFPSGQRTSRLGVVVETALVVAVVAMIVSSNSAWIAVRLGPSVDADLLSGAVTIGLFASIVLAYLGALLDLGLRYRRADAIRRIQMRWVLAAEAICLALIVLLALFGDQVPDLFVLWLSSMGLPVLAIAIALTRYHLYEIDRIVSRSISYLVVTAVLVAVFGSTVLTLQAAISSAVAAPGASLDPRVVAISTLVVAALFDPLRQRVQAVVDRRFNRRRYDSGRLAAGFGGRMRGQVDLPAVSRDLRQTTVDALEPTTTGVWLRARVTHG